MVLDEDAIEGLSVWWLTFGTERVLSQELLKHPFLAGRFIWSQAEADGYLEYSYSEGGYRITHKALELLKGRDHG